MTTDRHVDGNARMALDEQGTILAVDIDFTYDVGAYPTPYPVLTTAAVGMFFPGPYRVPKASFNYKTVFSNTAGLAAYRGPWQYETLAREILLDIAARKMSVDPVDLRRQNLLRRDEMPYFNPNGMPYDHVAPIETFEQAVKILDHEGFRKEQAEALAQGRYIGLGFSALVVVAGVMKAAIEADVKWPIALRAFVAKANAILGSNFSSAVKAVHRSYHPPMA